ncbi:MAG TPA: FtsH protease activity modulator HflK [Gammaproteobacteria bacterium]|nr:FtsH protease activity modulator HflK [Gammaproteobacteria bacterium]
MAWNEPGGPDDKDPWGSRKQDQGPPDLDEAIRKLQQKLKGLFGGGGAGGGRSGGGGAPKGAVAGVGALLAVVVLGWVAYDSVYIIQPAERGVVQRFGKYVATLQPGPNIRLPRPIETVTRVDVDQIRTLEIGYRAEGRQASSVLNESLMLTQDENIVDIKLAVQYKVKDPADYLFRDRGPDLTLRKAAESAIREVVGKNKMDFVVGEGRAAVAARTQEVAQAILDRYRTGLLVTSVNLQDAQPPEPVQEAFNDAIRAREDRERFIKQAEAYANEVIPKARGEAARIIEDANAYRARVVAESEGNASRFTQVLAEYKKAPDVTRERLYLETLESVLTRSSKIVVDVENSNNLLYLPLDQLGKSAPDDTAAAPPVAPVRMAPATLMEEHPSSSQPRSSSRSSRGLSREVR